MFAHTQKIALCEGIHGEDTIMDNGGSIIVQSKLT